MSPKAREIAITPFTLKKERRYKLEKLKKKKEISKVFRDFTGY
jgi:hypothetical protein